MPLYSWIGLLDPQGRVVEATDGALQGVLAAHLSWAWAREVEKSILDSMKAEPAGKGVLRIHAG